MRLLLLQGVAAALALAQALAYALPLSSKLGPAVLLLRAGAVTLDRGLPLSELAALRLALALGDGESVVERRDVTVGVSPALALP